MNNKSIFRVKDELAKNALVDKAAYEKIYKRSINDNENFWREQGKRINWIKPYTKIKDVKFSSKDTYIKWFYDGSLNASVNCIDRHVDKDPNRMDHRKLLQSFLAGELCLRQRCQRFGRGIHLNLRGFEQRHLLYWKLFHASLFVLLKKYKPKKVLP